MEPITIRTATLNDLDVLLGFEKNLIDSDRRFDPTFKEDNIHYYDIVQMITEPHIEIVVAVVGPKIIGCGYARIETPKVYLKHQKHAYFGFMYVEPNYRGAGVNGKVMDVLKQWSLSQMVTELRLDVYHDNVNAIKAYEKIGFTKLKIEMRMNLGRPGAKTI
jgi:ribosomal protein S18 acetylase RimI-like enzyme